MWISKSGSSIKSEPVYQISNPDNKDEQKIILSENTGGFPGNSHYHKELNFIDQTLINARTAYRFEENNGNIKSPSIDVSGGNLSLYKYHASITENADSYTIQLNIEQIGHRTPLDMMNRPDGFREAHLVIIFNISKSDGHLNGIKFEKHTPPVPA